MFFFQVSKLNQKIEVDRLVSTLNDYWQHILGSHPRIFIKGLFAPVNNFPIILREREI